MATEGYLVSPKLLQQIQNTVRHYLNLYGGGGTHGYPSQWQIPFTGKLTTTMAAASDFGTAPATATVAIWAKDDSGNMVDSGRSVDVVNRFLRITGEIGDIVTVHWIDGEWRVSGIDCGA